MRKEAPSLNAHHLYLPLSSLTLCLHDGKRVRDIHSVFDGIEPLYFHLIKRTADHYLSLFSGSRMQMFSIRLAQFTPFQLIHDSNIFTLDSWSGWKVQWDSTLGMWLFTMSETQGILSQWWRAPSQQENTPTLYGKCNGLIMLQSMESLLFLYLLTVVYLNGL